MEMDLQSRKKAIENSICDGDVDSAYGMICDYEKICPFDAELLSIWTAYYMLVGDMDQAYTYAKSGVTKLPLNPEMQYNYAVVCENTGDVFEAYRAYVRTAFLLQYSEDTQKLEELQPRQRADELINRVVQIIEGNRAGLQEAQALLEKIKALSAMEATFFGMREIAYRSCNMEMIGDWFYESLDTKKYIGAFKDQYFTAPNAKAVCKDLVRMKGEFLEAEEKTSCKLSNDGLEYILPVLAAAPKSLTVRTPNKEKLTIAQYARDMFYYYKLPGGSTVESAEPVVFGRPIPIRQDPNKKKLVLSIFVDGLSYSILRGDRFRENMPYTYEFFRQGTIFNNAINVAEWTYPSIASYVTGVHTTRHMLFHHSIDYPMPEEIPTLAETMQAGGYYTSKYCGNWRIIPPYGHSRGYDRFVYQHQSVGFKVQEVIGDAINQIDAARDLNHYMWISIGDLHDIADKVDLPMTVQRDLPIENRVYHQNGATSVKQVYNPDDKLAYIRLAKHVDKWLHILFSYIEENYRPEDYVISLFSDHGQGYLIEEKDAHFLAKERSNVPMMFRGGDAEGIGYVDECISALDYAHVMRKLAGVEEPDAETEGMLPVTFGGDKERPYAYTESIHPGDPYFAAIFSPREHVTFFFENSEPVLDDGRFSIGELKYWLEDESGNRIENSELTKKYLDVVMDHIAWLIFYK